MAYPKDFRSFLIPIAVTTTSSNVCESSCKVTEYEEAFVTLSIAVLYPIKDISNVLPAGASTENFPSTSVTAPVPEPFTSTLAPMIGSPAASKTLPVIFLAC